MGRIYRATYTVAGPDGNRVTKEAPGWYIELTDAAGRTKRRKGGLTEAAAKDALRQAEGQVLLEKNGLPTQAAGDLLCTELLDSYVLTLRHRDTARHAVYTERHIRGLLAGTRALVLRDLKPDAVERYLASLSEGGLAARSVNAPLVAIKSCLNWAVATRRIPYNPLGCLKAVAGPKVRVRRALSEAELGALLAASLDGPRRRALRQFHNRPGKDGTFKAATIPLPEQARLASEGRNAVLSYRLMAEAGLRVNEARCLLWRDVDLDAGLLHLRAETTKNGKADTLPLAQGLLEALQARKAETRPDEGASVVTITSRALKSFDDDLQAAGIAKRDGAGRTLDLHSLRTTCATRLVASGADIKTTQTLLRHSTPNLSLALYVRSDRNRLAQAVAGLPELKPTPLAAPEAAAALKTGTDDLDLIPENEPKSGVLPLSIRQGISRTSQNSLQDSDLATNGVLTLNQRVEGSSPSGRISKNARNPTQTRATARFAATLQDPAKTQTFW